MTDTREPCACTLVAQDETCPIGYPSLLCPICDAFGTVAPYSEGFVTNRAICAAIAERDILRTEAHADAEAIGALREALKPFAKEAAWWADKEYRDDEAVVEGFPGYDGEMTVGDLYAARAALEPKP